MEHDGMDQQGTFKLGTIGGIDVKAHWGWVLVLFLFTFQLAVSYFPQQMPGETDLSYWILGFISALLLFASVLLHEFSHSFVARARGYKVRDITLFIFGGVSSIEEESKKASDEFWIAVVGPLTSVLLAVVFYGLLQVVTPPVRRVGAGAAAILQYLALINFLLALFNMIPGFPLDGGRVLRSIIWGITRNGQRATRIAGFVGQLVAYGFMLWGLLTIFQGDFFSGIWIGFIGWFLLSAAQQTTSGTAVRDMLRGVTVGQLMEPSPPTVPAHMPLAQLLTQYILPYNLRSLPVVDEYGRLVGVITLSDIRDIPQDQWGIATVGQVMQSREKLQAVRPQDSLEGAVQVLMDGQLDQLPVVDPFGRLIGVLSRANVLRWMQIRDELKLRPPSEGPQPPNYPNPQSGQYPGSQPPPPGEQPQA
jgi:Zn-dependent protease/CBS domain-containing protein